LEQRLVYRDAFGVRRTMIADDERSNRFAVLTEQDVEPILDGVARDRELYRHNGPNKVLARIPLAIAERFMTPDGWDEAALRKWINSAEAEPFRIWRGRI
jgi:hypothetical protein